MAVTKSRHAFGSEANVDNALTQGLIDEFDILFLSEGKIGWIDKDGNKVILEDKRGVMTVDTLPDVGESNIVYICNGKFYFWNDTQFSCPSADGGIDEATIDTKVEAGVTQATQAANAYTDEQIAEAVSVVEF